MRYGLLFQNLTPPPPFKDQLNGTGMCYFIVVRPHYISMIDGEPHRFCALRSADVGEERRQPFSHRHM